MASTSAKYSKSRKGTRASSPHAIDILSLTNSKSLTITGLGQPRISGTFSGLMMDVMANNVTIQGLSLTGSGRPDLWIYYDASRDGEIIVKEERDLNGDGITDLWTYYENGRIVRRDVNAAGLEILSKKEQLPAPGTELTKISIPGS